MKKKVYVIIVSKVFPLDHPRKGDPISFEDKINHLDKKHTIRGNYAFWKPRIDAINRYEAYLSIRQWSGKPYASKQVEIAVFGAGEVGIQKCNVKIVKVLDTNCASIKVDDINCSIDMAKEIAKNDGLSQKDFINWFKYPITDGCIIHFTDLRY